MKRVYFGRYLRLRSLCLQYDSIELISHVLHAIVQVAASSESAHENYEVHLLLRFGRDLLSLASDELNDLVSDNVEDLSDLYPGLNLAYNHSSSIGVLT